ncbi:class II aldolase/adducin family protein [Thermosulfuriphilus sp.]
METEARELIETCRRLYQRGLVAGSEGNVSLRCADGRILATPSGRNKGLLESKDLCLLSAEGGHLSGPKASSEMALHLQIYRLRPDVSAIIHTHPPYVLALTIAGFSLTEPLLAEGALFFKDLELAPFAVPGTDEVPAVVAPLIRRTNVVVLERHGLVAVGKGLEEAFNLTDMLEHLAKTYWLTYALNPQARPLGIEELDRLRRFHPWQR